MNFLKDVGFVIRRQNYSEADRFVTFYTQHNGKIDVLAKGVRKLSSKRSSYIELLNNVRFQAVQGKRGWILTEVSLLNAFTHKRQTLTDIEKLFYVAELVGRLCPAEEKNSKVYDLLCETMVNGVLKNGMKRFQTEILTHLGYWDQEKSYHDEKQINHYIESIIERKLHSYTALIQ